MPYIGTSPSNGVRRKHTYTATASQTSFSGAGAEGATLSYNDSNFVDVYQNGVKLSEADYTSTSGTAIVLAQGASVSDIVEVVVYDVFSVADTVSKADGGTFDGNITAAGTLGVTGNTTVGGTLDVTGAITSSAGATITTANNLEQLTLISTDTDANQGPVLRLRRDSASPADNDIVGYLIYSADNDAGQITDFAGIRCHIDDVSDGTEDGNLKFFTNKNGTEISRMGLASSETVFNEDSVDVDFRVESNNNDRSFVVDGADGIILMGTSHTNVISVDGRHGIVLNEKTNGFYLGVGQFSANGNATIILNRDSDDGSIQLFFQDATEIGSISTSGSTVSYNAFSGSHWSRLSDNSKPTILKGTIIETIDEMCDWYQAEFTVVEEEDGKTINRTAKNSIALPNGKSVGDTITHTFEGKDYSAKIIKEADNKHTKCKISDTADSKRVYGVYAAWDNDDDTVNDMYVTAVGTHVVRINKDVTVTAGDLLSSNGDGTAKVQDDDIIRSKTIGKVLTNIKQETYDDGSYTVPCALYCG